MNVTRQLILCAGFAAAVVSATAQEETVERKCPEVGANVRVISLERRGPGDLFLTFDIQNNSNRSFRIGSAFGRVEVIDNNGETWDRGRTNWHSLTFVEGARTKVEQSFGRKLGGQDAKTATVKVSFSQYDGGPARRCRATFSDVAIKEQ